MREDGKIDYVEFPGASLAATKAFYRDAFGWTFTDYGPDYAAFEAGVDGGFDASAKDQTPLPLVVLYARDLEAMAARVQAAGAVMLRPIYTFPGGRRFHFRDPSGNELAVWSDVLP